MAAYDKTCSEFIINGFRQGFSLCYDGPYKKYRCKNLKSACENPTVVWEKINKEIIAGRVAGPFSLPPFENFRVSPIGLVPKKEPGEFQLIHHLSYPPGDSVNDNIDPSFCSVQYTKFDNAVKIVQKLGRGALLGKADIRSAFRLIPLADKDFPQVGFMHDGLYFYDKMLPFGCSISCAIFEKFATCLQWIIRKNCPCGEIDHYLDDFIFGGQANSNHCLEIMKTFFGYCMKLGIPVAEEKTVWPTTVMVFLGLELDSLLMQVRIPHDKIEQLIGIIKTVLAHKQSVTLKEMQSLLGSLNFVCRAVAPGRPFCRRLINSTCGVTKSYHHIKIKSGMRKDLSMWLKFLSDFNGISMFNDSFWSFNTDICLHTDSSAATGHGFGAMFGSQWTIGIWPQYWHDSGLTSDITILEFYPILVAVHVWGRQLANKKVLFKCDNQAVVNIINNQTSKSDRVMVLVRAFTLQCLKLNIVFRAEHVPGSKNLITDSLSRLQMEKFRQLAPNADKHPQIVPDQLWSIFNEGPID